MVLRGLLSISLLKATQTPSRQGDANYLPTVDAVLYTVRMYALNNDEHRYEGCSCIRLTGSTYWRCPHCVRR